MKKVLFSFLIVLISLISYGCNFIEYEPSKIIVDSDTIQLEWDPPEVKSFDEGSTILYYRVYYRIHDVGRWVTLDIIPAQDHPKYEIHHSDFGNGAYDFAVRAVSASSRYSALHSSLDPSADPLGGWYVVWIRF